MPSAGGSSGSPPQAPGARSSPPTGPEAPQPRCGTRPLLATPQGGAFWRSPFFPAWFAPPCSGPGLARRRLPGRPPRARAALLRVPSFVRWSAARALPPGPPLVVVEGLFPAALECRAAVWGACPLVPWSVFFASLPPVRSPPPGILGRCIFCCSLLPVGFSLFPPRPLPPLGGGGARGWYGGGPVLSRRVRSFWVGAGAH